MDKRYVRLKATEFFANQYGIDLMSARMCHHETIEMMVEFHLKMKKK